MTHWQADGVLIFVAFVWGATFVVVKDALALVGPLVFVAVRFWIASAALAPLARPGERTWTPGLLRDGALTGGFLVAGYIAQTVALTTSEASKVAFLTGLSVALVPLCAAVLLRQLPSAPASIGVALALAGLGAMTLDRSLRVAPGDGWGALCGLLFAFQILAVGRFAPRHAALPFTLVQMATAAGLATVAALWGERAALMPPDAAWPALLFMGWVATALLFLLQARAQRHTTATHAALIFALEPVFAALVGYAWAGEELARREWLGGALILVGMLVAELGERNRAG